MISALPGMYTYIVTRAKVLEKLPLLDILISDSKTFRDKRCQRNNSRIDLAVV